METTIDAVTMQIAGARLTVPTEALFQAWLRNTLAVTPAEATPTTQPPRIGTYWQGQGGIYAGIARGEVGKRDYHLIVPTHADARIAPLAWGGQGQDEPGANSEYDGLANTLALFNSTTDHPAADWASRLVIDGHRDLYLPARRELALCFANVPELFDRDWHWSSTQHAATSNYAWVQHFSYGSQDNDDKSSARLVRVVRRLEI